MEGRVTEAPTSKMYQLKIKAKTTEQTKVQRMDLYTEDASVLLHRSRWKSDRAKVQRCDVYNNERFSCRKVPGEPEPAIQ
jgi:hypothetical protein